MMRIVRLAEMLRYRNIFTKTKTLEGMLCDVDKKPHSCICRQCLSYMKNAKTRFRKDHCKKWPKSGVITLKSLHKLKTSRARHDGRFTPVCNHREETSTHLAHICNSQSIRYPVHSYIKSYSEIRQSAWLDSHSHTLQTKNCTANTKNNILHVYIYRNKYFTRIILNNTCNNY